MAQPLSEYVSDLTNLIQAPTSPIPLLTQAQLQRYINVARQQVAIDGECVRGYGSTTIAAGVVSLPIASITPVVTGTEQAIVVRNATLGVTPATTRRVDQRPWDWFFNYYGLGGPQLPVIPTPVMALQGQGSLAVVWMSSQDGGVLNADAVLLPAYLVDDTTPDAIPYPWVDAVNFYAAWYCYMSLQRQADAQTMWGRYQEVVRRARTGSTSTALPENDPGGVGAGLASVHQTLGAQMPQMPQGGAQRAG